MKLNGIKISERLLEGALINMLQVGRNAGTWAGTRYRYDVSQNYKTDDEYIDEDDFKLPPNYEACLSALHRRRGGI